MCIASRMISIILRVYWPTVRYAGSLAKPPTLTTTGSFPVPTPEGTVKLICKTPTDQLGSPIYVVDALTPPTVTSVVPVGTGVVRLEGLDPSETAGSKAPAPLTYIVRV